MIGQLPPTEFTVTTSVAGIEVDGEWYIDVITSTNLDGGRARTMRYGPMPIEVIEANKARFLKEESDIVKRTIDSLANHLHENWPIAPFKEIK